MINRESITTLINNYIIENIDNGNFKVGQKIPSESALCKELNVSRASLRASLGQFIALGILQSIHGKGTYLISNNTFLFSRRNSSNLKDYDDVKNVLQLRILIEPEAAFLCAQKIASEASNELLHALEQTFQDMQNNINNAEEFIKADLRFHSLIAYGSGNSVIGDALNHTFATTYEQQVKTNELFGFKDGISYHKKIIEAFSANDAPRAKKLMHNHLKHAIDAIELM